MHETAYVIPDTLITMKTPNASADESNTLSIFYNITRTGSHSNKGKSVPRKQVKNFTIPTSYFTYRQKAARKET